MPALAESAARCAPSACRRRSRLPCRRWSACCPAPEHCPGIAIPLIPEITDSLSEEPQLLHLLQVFSCLIKILSAIYISELPALCSDEHPLAPRKACCMCPSTIRHILLCKVLCGQNHATLHCWPPRPDPRPKACTTTSGDAALRCACCSEKSHRMADLAQGVRLEVYTARLQR